MQKARSPESPARRRRRIPCRSFTICRASRAEPRGILNRYARRLELPLSPCASNKNRDSNRRITRFFCSDPTRVGVPPVPSEAEGSEHSESRGPRRGGLRTAAPASTRLSRRSPSCRTKADHRILNRYARRLELPVTPCPLNTISISNRRKTRYLYPPWRTALFSPRALTHLSKFVRNTCLVLCGLMRVAPPLSRRSIRWKISDGPRKKRFMCVRPVQRRILNAHVVASLF